MSNGDFVSSICGVDKTRNHNVNHAQNRAATHATLYSTCTGFIQTPGTSGQYVFWLYNYAYDKGGGIGAAMAAPLLARTWTTPYDHALIN